MKGLLKRLGAFLAPEAREEEASAEQHRLHPPDEFDDDTDAEPSVPHWNGLPEDGGTIEQYNEAFRHGLIGFWQSRKGDPASGGETMRFSPDNTGLTYVWDANGQQVEECIFEWQPLTDRCIRVRVIAWMDIAEDEESDEAEDDSEHEDEEDLEEPDQGEWETIYYDFRTDEVDGEETIVLFRADYDGFPCAFRAGEGPVKFDWAAVRKHRDKNLLRASALKDEELLIQAAANPIHQPDQLLRSAEEPVSGSSPAA